MSRPIAILGGTGPAGLGLALRWARAGETVIIGSRSAERAREAASKIKERVGGAGQVSGEENSVACPSNGTVSASKSDEAQALWLLSTMFRRRS